MICNDPLPVIGGVKKNLLKLSIFQNVSTIYFLLATKKQKSQIILKFHPYMGKISNLPSTFFQIYRWEKNCQGVLKALHTEVNVDAPPPNQ